MEIPINNAVVWMILSLALYTSVGQLISESGESTTIPTINRAVLIFLDDSEGDAATESERIGILSLSFALALEQEAGPIIVSASILDNMRHQEDPTDTSPTDLIERFKALRSNFNELNDTELTELKNIYRYLLPFDEDTTDSFIIKKISAELYLIIPKKYLGRLNIDEKEVEYYTKKHTLTKTERHLGLRVNHMQTITNIDEIQKPVPAPSFAHYFIDALHDKTTSIFITSGEYYAHNDTQIPLWSLYIMGHGTMGNEITALSIDKFKDFLTFLEQKIHTKLLYYLSCYGAGINHKALYKNIENGIDKTYPFAIIAQAIMDTPVNVYAFQLAIEDNNLTIFYFQYYRKFIDFVTTSEIIDYKALADCFKTFLKIGGIGSMLPQVKLPGLPWFSVIHEDRICSIGSILATTRTKPLNIETFFARQGKKAVPLGILVYAPHIPFELIINSKTELDLPPTIVSMIPGDTMHHIKKISSSAHTVETLLNHLFQIKGLKTSKTFVIDELIGSDIPTGVHKVVVELTPQKNTIYYMHNDVLYKNMKDKTTNTDAMRYKKLITLPQQEKFEKHQHKVRHRKRHNNCARKCLM